MENKISYKTIISNTSLNTYFDTDDTIDESKEVNISEDPKAM